MDMDTRFVGFCFSHLSLLDSARMLTLCSPSLRSQLYALSSSHDSTLIATSCKSTNALHAVVRLYSTKTWKPLLNTLGGHSLTVTRIAFSRDDRFIVTVGRDRGWGVYERDTEGEGEL